MLAQAVFEKPQVKSIDLDRLRSTKLIIQIFETLAEGTIRFYWQSQSDASWNPLEIGMRVGDYDEF